MENLTEYTTEQLKGQSFSVMTTIKMMEAELSEDVINKMYEKVSQINNEIRNRESNLVKTDSMFS